MFDKPTVPDFVKSEIAPILLKLKHPARAINGNHDRLYDNEEYNYKTSFQVLCSHGVIKELKSEDFPDVYLTSEVPVLTRNKPQIVLFHGFLNIEDGKNTFRFTDLRTDDNVFVMLGHDHVEYEPLQYTSKIRIFRPGSFTRGVRAETNLRTPKMIHIKVVDGTLKAKAVEVECRAWEEIFKTKESKITKAQQRNTYEDIISQIRNASVCDMTFRQAMQTVSDPDVVEYAMQVLEEAKLDKTFKRV